ncbi:MAG TPA: phosphate acyltransferase PlsX [Phycisphaerales bacterium]|nr:phosphate acyltransferase PlsX [Phycisphaerales bacterium]
MTMTIAVDAMGGDDAPGEIVKGAFKAAKSSAAQILLVGDERAIKKHLPPPPLYKRRGIEIVHCDDYIRMDESPGTSLRRRTSASLVVAARLVKDGKAQALVSAGNTGALHQIALLEVGRLKGIRRPALAALLPSEGEPVVALDLGANADCKPEYLLQFAHMGDTYSREIMGIQNPRVGLLNIGTEVGKGNTLVNQAHDLLSESNLNFVGNVEPLSIFQAEVDVVVCDGFVGNMMLKSAEAISEFILKRMKQAASLNARAKLGGLMLRPSLRSLKQDISHSDHGGAILLGLKGIVIKCHGRADRETVRNGIKAAEQALERDVLGRISENLNASEVKA